MPRIDVEQYKTNVPAGTTDIQVKPEDVGFNLGPQLEELGKAKEKMDERDAKNWVISNLSAWQIQENTALQDAKATGDPADFTGRFLEGHEARKAEFLKGAPNALAAEFMSYDMSRWKDTLAAGAINFEATQRQKIAVQGLNTDLNNSKVLAGQEPDMAPLLQEQYSSNVKLQQDRLDPDISMKFETQGAEILYTGAQGVLTREPDTFIRKAEAGEYNTAYASKPEALSKDIVRAREYSEKLKKRADNQAFLQNITDQNSIHAVLANTFEGSTIEESFATIDNTPTLSPEIKDQYKDFLIQGRQSNAGINNSTYMSLANDVTNMELTISDGRADPVRDNTKIAEWMNKYNKALLTRQIPAKDGELLSNKMRKAAAEIVNSDIYHSEEIGEGDDAEVVPLSTALSRVTRGNPNSGLAIIDGFVGPFPDVAQQGELYRNYLSWESQADLDSITNPMQRAEKVRAGAQQVIDSYVRRTNPKFAQYKTLPNSLMNGSNKIMRDPNPVDLPTQGSVSSTVKKITMKDGTTLIPFGENTWWGSDSKRYEKVEGRWIPINEDREIMEPQPSAQGAAPLEKYRE